MNERTKQGELLRTKTYGLKALIVDFDLASLANLSSFFKELGMEVIIARDGLAGLEQFRTQRPHVVLLEAMLPKISGFELSQQIQTESQGKVPVIMVTGIYKDTRHKIEAIQTYGAAAFLTKPWKREEMEKTLLDVLSPAVTPPAEEEELISEGLDDLSSLIKKGLPFTPPPPPPKMESIETKAKKMPRVSDEVDNLLEKALADIGVEAKKADVPEPKKPITTEIRPSPKPTISKLESKPKEPEPQPWYIKAEEAKKSKAEVKDAPVSVFPKIEKEIPKGPPISEVETREIKESKPSLLKAERKSKQENYVKVEKETVYQPLYSDFLEAKQEKKKPLPYLMLGITAALALTFTAIFLFKPKKQASPPPSPVVVSFEPSVSQAAQDLPSRLEEQETTAKVAKTKVMTKESSPPNLPPPAKKEETTIEEAPPILLAEASPKPLPLPPIKTEGQTVPPEKAVAIQEEAAPASKSGPSPEPKIKEGDLVPLEEVDIPPKSIKIVEPKYPEVAKQMRLEGSVVVNALISENGDVIRTEILRGIRNGTALEQAAQAAIRQWKFTPAVKNGVKVKVWRPIETRFRIK